jgi:hypothetical protein
MIKKPNAFGFWREMDKKYNVFGFRIWFTGGEVWVGKLHYRVRWAWRRK